MAIALPVGLILAKFLPETADRPLNDLPVEPGPAAAATRISATDNN